LVALRGETEGFQLVIRARASRLQARLSSGSDSFLSGKVRLLRVGFVRIEHPSTGIGFKRGLYADPLPAQVQGSAMRARGWAGFVVLVDSPHGAAPGVYRGAIEIRSGERLLATRPFSIRVAGLQAITGDDPRSFRAIGGLSRSWYERFAPTASFRLDGGAQARAQTRNLLGFLSEHQMTPIDIPTEQGLEDYQRLPWPAKLLPNRLGSFFIQRDWSSRGAGHLRSLWASWQSRDWIAPNTYFWVWDEPAGTTERRDVPAINQLVHGNAPGVKTFMTGFPYLRGRISGKSNRHLWDGGADDVDAWAIAPHRFYGRWTTRLERRAGIDRSQERRRSIGKLSRAGKEVWSYTYFMPTRSIPQLVIDGPPTDPRLLMLWNAHEGNSGWLVWQIARWVDGRRMRQNRLAPRDPYRDTISSTTPVRRRQRGRQPRLPAGGATVRSERSDRSACHVATVRVASRRNRGRESRDALPGALRSAASEARTWPRLRKRSTSRGGGVDLAPVPARGSREAHGEGTAADNRPARAGAETGRLERESPAARLLDSRRRSALAAAAAEGTNGAVGRPRE